MSLWAEAWDYWRAGGPLLIPLAAVSLVMWAQFLRLRAHYRRLLRECDALLEDPSPTDDDGCLRPGLDASVRAGDSAEDALARCREQLRDLWSRESPLLAALAGVAPLLGLLGTVAGMIDTFVAVAEGSGQTATRVAGGISTALITTQVGLVIALPGLFGAVRIDRLARALDGRLAEYGTLRRVRRRTDAEAMPA